MSEQVWSNHPSNKSLKSSFQTTHVAFPSQNSLANQTQWTRGNQVVPFLQLTSDFCSAKQQSSTFENNPDEVVDLQLKQEQGPKQGYDFTTLPVLPIQTKLTIGEPNDQYEQEADRVAARVVQQLNDPTTVERDSNDNLDVFQNINSPDITQLQCQSINAHTEASTEVERAISTTKGQGQPLSDNVRGPIEQAFGYDFSGVRIHTDNQSTQLNQAVQAKAFTTGQDIYFRTGAYQPGIQGGQELLAHELTHVVQQNGSSSQPIQKVDNGDFSSDEETASTPSDATATADEEIRHNLTIGDASSSHHEVLENATTTEALDALQRHYRHIRGWFTSDKERHRIQRNLRERHYIVGFICDLAGGVEMPPIEMWGIVQSHLDAAQGTGRAGLVGPTVRNLRRAEDAWRERHQRLLEYIDGTISGGETSVTVLEYTAVAGAVAASVATGGSAAAAGYGLAATSAVSGLTAASYGATQEFAGQTGELGVGLREEYDTAAIIRRAAIDGATGLIGSLVGGALSNVFKRAFGGYLSSSIGDDVLLELGEQMGLGGPLPRDYFLTGGQHFIADFFGGVGASPLNTAATALINIATDGDSPESAEAFAEQVVQEMAEGAIMDLFISAFTQSLTGVASRRSSTHDAHTPSMSHPETASSNPETSRSSASDASSQSSQMIGERTTPTAHESSPRASESSNGDDQLLTPEPLSSSDTHLETRRLIDELGGVNEQTEAMLNSNAQLRDAVEQYPHAARAMKYCHSPCLPPIPPATRADYARFDALIHRTGGIDNLLLRLGLRQQQLSSFLHDAADSSRLSHTLAQIEDYVRSQEIREVHAASQGEHGEIGSGEISSGEALEPNFFEILGGNDPRRHGRARRDAGIGLAEDHHIATRYREENRTLLESVGLHIDNDLNLMTQFEEHGQLRGWYDWESGRYAYRMRGHHRSYNRWVTQHLEQVSPPGLPPEQALRNIVRALQRLRRIIERHPEVLSHGPSILPPHLQNLTP